MIILLLLLLAAAIGVCIWLVIRGSLQDTKCEQAEQELAALRLQYDQNVSALTSEVTDLKAQSAKYLAQGKNYLKIARETAASQKASEARAVALLKQVESLNHRNELLSKWSTVADAEERASDLLRDSTEALREAEQNAKEIVDLAKVESDTLIQNAIKELESAHDNAKRIIGESEQQAASKAEASTLQAAALMSDGRVRAAKLLEDAQHALAAASARSSEIISAANKRAEEIAGEAYNVVRDASLYEKTVQAMKNIIEGYGDRYLQPPASLIDHLAEEFEHKDAGQNLKLARAHTKTMMKDGSASKCDYVESNRREGAERFVLDAFNGKVDSILSRVRSDNAGKLAQEIKDAFTLVNYNGKAFREARITEEYLNARLEELKWASIAQHLKQEEQEEQRLLREQIREEEKAKREFERAIRDSEKEEDILRKAMAKAELQIAAATAEQKAAFEQQLQELNAKLKEAEERNQRAISMAQQTKKGHVYIISNIGSLGEDVYKIGLTRRLEPLDRVRELGDSSVPFEFDVHALILSDDAPALEYQLHKHFVMRQVNKVNYRKEFFRASLTEIRSEIETLGIVAKWTMASEAREYRESMAIERAIKTDPVARQSWINHQLSLDPTEYMQEAFAAAEEKA